MRRKKNISANLCVIGLDNAVYWNLCQRLYIAFAGSPGISNNWDIGFDWFQCDNGWKIDC